jgi:hypothetical protein
MHLWCRILSQGEPALLNPAGLFVCYYVRATLWGVAMPLKGQTLSSEEGDGKLPPCLPFGRKGCSKPLLVTILTTLRVAPLGKHTRKRLPYLQRAPRPALDHFRLWMLNSITGKLKLALAIKKTRLAKGNE